MKENNGFKFILLIGFVKCGLAALVLVLALSGCGLVSCMGESNGQSNSGNCNFGATPTMGSTIFNSNIPPLPSIESAANQQYTTQTVYVDSRNSNWTATGITLNGNEQVTIQVVPTSISPAAPNNSYPTIANGTINTCYFTDYWDFSEGGSWWYDPTKQGVQPNVYYYPGPVQMLALLDPGASSYTPQITAYNPGPIGNYCNDGQFTSCPSPFDTNCSSFACSGQNGQGLVTNFLTDSGTALSAGCSSNFLGSAESGISCPNYSPANVLPLYSSTLFNGGAAILKIPSTNSLCTQIVVPYQDFPAVQASIFGTLFNTCDPGNSGNCAVINTNYHLYHTATGCYGVNGGMETQPPGGNANIGQLQYFISPSYPPASSGDGNFPNPIGAFIDPTKTDDAGIVSTTFNAPAGELYLQVYDCVNSSGITTAQECIGDRVQPSCYADNFGQYEVQIITPKPNSQTFIDIITTVVINAIANQNQIVSAQMFGYITAPDSLFRNIVNATLILYVIVYGISFAFGIVMVTQKDAIIRVMKIGAVLVLISSNSSAFFTYLYDAFQNGLPYLASLAGGGDGSVSDLFSFANVTMAYLTNIGVWCRILVFMYLFPIGWFLWTIACYAVVVYAIVIIEAFIAYLVAITGIALFIALAPFFIILVLFNLTRPIFDNWIKILSGFVIQPVLLFSCIGVVNTLVLTALNNLLQDISYRCLVPIFFDIGLFDINIVCFTAFIPNPFDLLNLITLALILFILVDVLKKMPSFVEEAGRFLSGAGASTITQTAASIRTSMVQSGKELVGMDQESVQRRAAAKQRALRAVNVAQAPEAPAAKNEVPPAARK